MVLKEHYIFFILTKNELIHVISFQDRLFSALVDKFSILPGSPPRSQRSIVKKDTTVFIRPTRLI